MILIDGRIDWPRAVPLGILAASVGALAVAYTAELGFGVEPCRLCLYQRVAYAVAGVFGILALLVARGRPRVAAVVLAGVAFALGSGVAIHHVGVEQHWWAPATSCGVSGAAAGPETVDDLRRLLREGPGKPCDVIDWTLFGLSMATYNVFVMAALAIGAFWGAGRMRRRP